MAWKNLAEDIAEEFGTHERPVQYYSATDLQRQTRLEESTERSKIKQYTSPERRSCLHCGAVFLVPPMKPGKRQKFCRPECGTWHTAAMLKQQIDYRFGVKPWNCGLTKSER